MDLDKALTQFDRTEANLRQLEGVVQRLEAMIPEGITFMSGSPEGREHNELRRRFAELVGALPALGGFRVEAQPLTVDEIAQWRMDAFEAGIPESLVDLDQQIAGPGESVADYRHRFERMRRELTRRRVTQLVGEIDELVARIRARDPQEAGKVDGDPEWPTLRDAASQLRRLTSPQSPGGSWNTLFRHLSFAEAVDLRDIVERTIPRRFWPKRIHPATRTFQALRIEVNHELESLNEGLQAAIRILRPGGRLGVVSFHSLEDTIVKNALHVSAQNCLCPPQQTHCTCAHRASLLLLSRKAIKPDAAELAANPRARSARLRVAEKLDDAR